MKSDRCCAQCGADISGRHRSAKYCIACSEKIYHESARARAARKRKAAAQVPLPAAAPSKVPVSCWRTDCRYWGPLPGAARKLSVCNYLLDTYQRRPCPIGDACTAYERRNRKGGQRRKDHVAINAGCPGRPRGGADIRPVARPAENADAPAGGGMQDAG